MITDRPPRKVADKTEFLRSEEMRVIKLPPVEPLRTLSLELEDALKRDSRADVKKVSNAIAAEFAKAYGIATPPVSVLGARPLEVNENSESELFGDYTFETQKIRLWMRTAVHKRVTAYGTFLSTLCHELCHHWDVVGLDMPNTYHTRGFYERAGLLYHHVRGTPRRPLIWDESKGGVYVINWSQTMRGGTK